MHRANPFFVRQFVCVALWIAASSSAGAQANLPENPFALDLDKACGLACVSFLDAYFTGTAPRHQTVLSTCPPGPRGVSLSQTEVALRELGFHTFAFRSIAADLVRLKRPAILLCGDGGPTNHFVVLIKWENGCGLVFDPPREVAWKDPGFFADHYQQLGVMVSPQPIADSDISPLPRVGWYWWTVAAALAVFLFKTLRAARRSRSHCVATASLVVGLCLGPGCTRGYRDTSESDSRSVDLGTLLQGTPMVHSFRLQNNTPVPFQIREASKACSCEGMVVDVDFEKTIHSGSFFEVTLSADTTGYRGRLTRSALVTTTSADPSLRTVRLTMRAEINSRIEAIPPQISFGVVKDGGEFERSLLVRLGDPSLETVVGAVTSTNPFVTVTRGASRPGLEQFTVSLDPYAPSGDIFGTLNVALNDPGIEDLKVSLHGRVERNLRSLPSQLVLPGSIGANDLPILLRVESTNGGELNVNQVIFPSGIGGTYLREANRGDLYTIRITSVQPLSLSSTRDVIVVQAHEDELRIPVSRVEGSHRSVLVRRP